MTSRPGQLRAVIFDLDGTLVDTADEFVVVVQALRAEHELAPMDPQRIRASVSNGARALVALGLGIAEEAAEFEGKRLRGVDVFLGVVVLAGVAILVPELTLSSGVTRGVLWGVAAVVFGGLSFWVLGIGLERTEAAVDAWHGRIADRTARGIVGTTLEITPFRVTYTIRGDTWRTVVEEPAQEVEVRRDEIGEFQTDAGVATLYKSTRSLRWKAVVWMVTDDVRRALDTFIG